MGELHHIGPLIKIKKIITEGTIRLLAESQLDYIKDRYELSSQILEALNKSSEVQGLFTDVINSFNGDTSITEEDRSMILPRMVISFFRDLDANNKHTQAP